jgi:hypothetical protein
MRPPWMPAFAGMTKPILIQSPNDKRSVEVIPTDLLSFGPTELYANFRATISFLISAMAFAGFRFFGQVRVQFMIVWQR